MKKKILIIDDEEDIANLVKLILEPVGFQVEMIFNPLQTYEALKKSRPDAIFLDLLMPGINGWEIFTNLRKDPDFCTIPIAILTAKTQGVDKVAGYLMKPDLYITKPFGKQELIDRTNELFRKKTE